MDKQNTNTIFPRRIKSFVLREGRFTEGQQRAFELHWENYGLDYSEDRVRIW